MAFKLRDYQDDAVVDVRLAFRDGKRRPLLVLSTGAGKTVIFSYIARSAAEKGNNVLILAHRDQLIKQASKKLTDYDVKHGIIMAGHTPSPRARVQVASVQTLVRRIEKMVAAAERKAEAARAAALAAGSSAKDADAAYRLAKKAAGFDLIVIDEAHLSAAKSYRTIVDAFPDALVLGVTGSPCRLDNKPLGMSAGGLYDCLIQGISIRKLIDRGFLVQPKAYAPIERLDLSGVGMVGGDYDQQQLAAVVDKPKITGSAVEHYQRICPGVPAVAWCVNVEHAQHVADEFCARGVPAVMLCGEHDTIYRDKILGQLASGEVKVVTFVGILVEGVDCPAITAVILLRPTMSLASYLQVIGRALRPIFADGMPLWTDDDRLLAITSSWKSCAYVLDHAGLTFRHGLADEEREWDLDAGEKKKKAGKKKDVERSDVIQCVGAGGCYGVFKRAPACPHCGKPVEVRARRLEHEEGQLEEITPEMAESMRKTKRREVETARSLEELQKIGAQRGYSAGWAKNVWDARQRKTQAYAPKPKEPSVAELRVMSLAELEKVSAAQGWPPKWASDFYHSQGAGADLFSKSTEESQPCQT